MFNTFNTCNDMVRMYGTSNRLQLIRAALNAPFFEKIEILPRFLPLPLDRPKSVPIQWLTLIRTFTGTCIRCVTQRCPVIVSI